MKTEDIIFFSALGGAVAAGMCGALISYCAYYTRRQEKLQVLDKYKKEIAYNTHENKIHLEHEAERAAAIVNRIQNVAEDTERVRAEYQKICYGDTHQTNLSSNTISTLSTQGLFPKIKVITPDVDTLVQVEEDIHLGIETLFAEQEILKNFQREAEKISRKNKQ